MPNYCKAKEGRSNASLSLPTPTHNHLRRGTVLQGLTTRYKADPYVQNYSGRSIVDRTRVVMRPMFNPWTIMHIFDLLMCPFQASAQPVRTVRTFTAWKVRETEQSDGANQPETQVRLALSLGSAPGYPKKSERVLVER